MIIFTRLGADFYWHCVRESQSQVFGAGIVVIFEIDNAFLQNADRVEVAVAGNNIVPVRASGHYKTPDFDLRFLRQETLEILLDDAI